MKYLKLSLIIFTIGLYACSEELLEKPLSGEGEVLISLTRAEDMKTIHTKGQEFWPNVDDFEVEIYSDTGKRRYRSTFAEAAGQKIRMNAGQYRLLAQYGDSLGVGFNSIYYAADTLFNVKGQQETQLHAIARMAKVQVAVTFGDILKLEYQEFCAKVRTSSGKALHFAQTETRAGYMPVGNLYLEVYAKIDGQWMMYRHEPIYCNSNDFITFNIDKDPRYGSLILTIHIDNTVENINKEWAVPGEFGVQANPFITVSGFGANNDVEVVEAASIDVPKDSYKADIVTMGGLQNCYLDIVSPYFPELSRVDLANLDEATKQKLKTLGFKWVAIKDQRLAMVDFSGFISYLSHAAAFNPSYPKAIATVQVTAVDKFGKQDVSDIYSVKLNKAEATLTIHDYNVWATNVNTPVATVTQGDPLKYKLQYKHNYGLSWTTVNAKEVQGNNIVFEDVSNLMSNNKYNFRLIYNGNEHNVSPIITKSTEAMHQVGNSNFDQWTNADFKYTITWGGTGTRRWWLPWSNEADAWWAVNSKKRMLGEVTLAYQEFKVMPTVSYSTTNKVSGYSAQIAVIATGAGASEISSGEATAGEMWIGTADGGGNHSSDGRAFDSRPTKVSFWRQYLPKGSEKYQFVLQLKDVNGNIIGAVNVQDGTYDSTGTVVTYNIEYTDLTKKAASIYMSFLASTSSSPSVSTGTFEMAGSNQRCWHGSILRVDNLTLHY